MDTSIKDFLDRTVRESYSTFNLFDIQYDENNIRCEIVDKYEVKNIFILKRRGDFKLEDVQKWITNILESYNAIYRLNNLSTEGKTGAFLVNYRYVPNVKTANKSVVTDWDFTHVDIALSLKSIELLKKNINEIAMESTSIAQYESIIDFLSSYLTKDMVARVVNVEFESSNILSAFKGAPIEKDELIEKVNKLQDKSGTLIAETTLASKGLRVLAKVNWVIDFDNISCDLAFEENKVLSTRDMKFIHDSDILSGLLKLYKPSIQEIFG